MSDASNACKELGKEIHRKQTLRGRLSAGSRPPWDRSEGTGFRPSRWFTSTSMNAYFGRTPSVPLRPLCARYPARLLPFRQPALSAHRDHLLGLP